MKKHAIYHPDRKSYDQIGAELEKLGYQVIAYSPGHYEHRSGKHRLQAPYFMFDDQLESWKKLHLINTLQQITFGSNVTWGVVNIDPDDGDLLQHVTLITMRTMVISVGYDQVSNIDDEGDGLWDNPDRARRELDAMSLRLERIMNQLIERLGGEKR